MYSRALSPVPVGCLANDAVQRNDLAERVALSVLECGLAWGRRLTSYAFLQALTKRSFASLVGHWRWSSARTKAVKQACGSQWPARLSKSVFAEVVDRWVFAQHQSRVRQALGVWR